MFGILYKKHLSFTIAILLFVQIASYSTAQVDARPNIIIFYTDDQRWDSLQYMPIVTERLIGEGTYFSNSFVTTSLCCPSRSSFLTGLYTHNHGVWTNEAKTGGGATKFSDKSTIATWLHDAGYSTGAIGKYMNEYGKLSPYIPPGWDDWHVFSKEPISYYSYKLNENGQIIQYGNAVTDYSTDVLRDKALAFIQNTQRPFFLWLSFKAPHTDVTIAGNPVIPAPRHVGTCDNIPDNRPPSFNEADVSDKPDWIRNVDKLTKSQVSAIDKLNRDSICSLKAVDEAIGKILDVLGSDIDNTAIIYTSDNGFLLGEHRLKNKNRIYEEAIRVPLVIRYSPLFAHATSDQLVLNIDLAPTIADIAGITPPVKVNGKNLLELDQWRTDFLIEHKRKEITSFGIRTLEYKYVEHLTADSSVIRELYDLKKDPYELNNVAKNTVYSDIKKVLKLRLAELRQE